jgi:hypothetical protein
MSIKTLSLAIGIAFAASSFGFAQQNNPAANQQGNPAASNPAASQQGNPASNAAASGGSGTHQTSQKTGSAANSQKVAHNQNGYRGRGHHGGKSLYSYYVRGQHCHMVHRPGHLVRVCRAF